MHHLAGCQPPLSKKEEEDDDVFLKRQVEGGLKTLSDFMNMFKITPIT